MIENIKSTYFVKNFFGFIEDERKLKLINYNKCLQKKLDINIINYMIFSRNILYMILMEKERYMMFLKIIYYLKVNLLKEKEMEKEKNMMVGMENYYLKENI